MKNIIFFICLLFLLSNLLPAMDNPNEGLIKKIISFSQISNNLDLVFEGKRLNITTDQSGTITTTVSTFLDNKCQHSFISPTSLAQTIIIQVNGNYQIINHGKSSKKEM